MTSIRPLYDVYTGTHYALDTETFVLRISSDAVQKETRLRPHIAAIVGALFTHHPRPVSYDHLRKIVEHHNLTCPDDTRLHRKISELRRFLTQFHPRLAPAIINTRGLGYSLPLHFKEPETIDSNPRNILPNRILQDVIVGVQHLIRESLALSKKCHITKGEDGFHLHRKPVHTELENLLAQYEEQNKRLHAELRLHPADFKHIRLECTLTRLKTYLGLARVSEFSITKEQWLEWHAVESNQLLADLIHQLKQLH